MIPKSATVIGFGRFGELWADLIKKYCRVRVIEKNKENATRARSLGFEVVDEEIGLSSETLFYCVPISVFEPLIKEHAVFFNERGPKQIFDCLSVKMHPKAVFQNLKNSRVEFGLLHPLFGPDSVRIHGIQGLPIAIDRGTLTESSFRFWRDIFTNIGLSIIEISAEEHDRFAAYSQGLAHYIGRILGKMEISQTPIDTLGAKKLYEIKDQVCNDTPELFRNLQQYNPFTLEMRIALSKAQAEIYDELLPDRINTERLVIGIQGGPGSFNEEAALFYMNKIGEKSFDIQYLYTSEAVLKALHAGTVDRGIFAIHNAQGGIVDESIQAMSRYNFSIVEEFSIIISHCLLTHPSATPSELTTVMGHSQAIKQCREKLLNRHPKLRAISGNGASADPAKASEELINGLISQDTAILGSKELARVYGLTIVDRDLQDLALNNTAFLFVKR